MLHPGNRVIWQLPRLTWPWQFCQRRVQAELQALLDAKHHGTAADMMALRNCLVALTGEGLQQERGALRAALLLRSRLADRLQLAEFLLSKLQGLAPLREGHNPLKHNRP